MLTTAELEQEISVINERFTEQYKRPIIELHKEEQRLADIKDQLSKQRIKLKRMLRVSIINDKVGKLIPGDVLLSEYKDLYLLFNGWMSNNIFVLYSDTKQGSTTFNNEYIKIKVNDITLYKAWDISNYNFWFGAKGDLFKKVTKIGNIN